MPITALQSERLQRALSEHDAALKNTERRPSSSSAKVHKTLLDLGRDEKLLTLIADFVDSPDLSDKLRRNPTSELHARGIELPDNVTMRVLGGSGEYPKRILRFEIKVRNATVLADWDPDVGACVKLARPSQ
jgi:hypothetical protein